MIPSLSRLNAPSLPRGQQINEAYIPSIASNYPGLRLTDLMLGCYKDPTYDPTQPLQTGQFFKWVLLQYKKADAGTKEHYRSRAAYFAVVSDNYFGENEKSSVYYKQLRALVDPDHPTGRIIKQTADETYAAVNDIMQEFPEQVSKAFGLFMDRGETRLGTLQALLELMPRIKAAKVPFDIMRFKSPIELDDWMREFQASTEKAFAVQESTVIFEGERYFIVHPKSWRAAVFWGRGTDWCTSRSGSSNYFNSYSAAGPLVIVMQKFEGKLDPIAQLFVANNGHYSTGVADIGTIILDDSDSLFNASRLYVELSSDGAIDSIAEFLRGTEVEPSAIPEVMERWEGGDLNHFALSDSDDYDDDEEDEAVAVEVEVDVSEVDTDPGETDSIFSVRVTNTSINMSRTIDIKIPRAPKVSTSVIQEDLLNLLGIADADQVIFLPKNAEVGELNTFIGRLRSEAIEALSLQGEEIDLHPVSGIILNELSYAMDNSNTAMVVTADSENAARHTVRALLGAEIDGWTFNAVTLGGRRWRPEVDISAVISEIQGFKVGPPAPYGPVAAATYLGLVYQDALSAWSKVGPYLVPHGPEIKEQALQVAAALEYNYPEAASGMRAWVELPYNSPEFWFQSLYYFYVYDSKRQYLDHLDKELAEKTNPRFSVEVQTTSKGEKSRVNIKYTYGLETLMKMVQAIRSLAPPSNAGDKLGRFLKAIDPDIGDLSWLKMNNPFIDMTENDKILYQAICLRLPIKKEDATDYIYWGSGVTDRTKSEAAYVYFSSWDRNSKVKVSESWAESAKSLESLGLPELAGLLPKSAPAEEVTASLSKALIRKGKRL
jgi:hypothetical protein